jgi:hypothetical protein
MTYSGIEMEIIRQIEATRGVNDDIQFDLEAMEDYLESLAYFNETESTEAMTKMIGWLGITLISICATLDVNFVNCLEQAYQEDQANQDSFEDEDS